MTKLCVYCMVSWKPELAYFRGLVLKVRGTSAESASLMQLFVSV